MKTSRHCKVRSSFVWMFAAGLAVTAAACNRHKDTGAPAKPGAPQERRAAPVVPTPAPVAPAAPSTTPAPFASEVTFWNVLKLLPLVAQSPALQKPEACSLETEL